MPWFQFENCEGYSINDADGSNVAYIDWHCDVSATEDAPADQNAEFIVRACNAFHKFVDAARLAQQLCELVERWADAEDSVECAELMDEIVSLAQGDTTGREALELAACPIVEPSADAGEEVRP